MGLGMEKKTATCHILHLTLSVRIEELKYKKNDNEPLKASHIINCTANYAETEACIT